MKYPKSKVLLLSGTLINYFSVPIKDFFCRTEVFNFQYFFFRIEIWPPFETISSAKLVSHHEMDFNPIQDFVTSY